MTHTGADLVASAKTRLDWNYEVDSHRLIGDTHTTDCSGFVYLAAKDCGIDAPTVSWTQARWCHSAGTDRILVDVALKIAGALLFKGANIGLDGFGSGGHVAISMGDGVNVIEAEGHARDVLIDPALGEGHPWTNCALMPGLDYGHGAVRPGAPIVEGNPMYSRDQICSVYTDGQGHAWGLFPNGAVNTLFPSPGSPHLEHYGSYQSLRDKDGHPLEARDDFAHITARPDGKPGYTLWPLHYTNPEQAYHFPVVKV